MARTHIKTAEEHIATIDAQTRIKKARDTQVRKELTEFKRKQAELENIYDLRDDLLSRLKNSGLSDEEVHSRCGPTPSTLRRWREDKYVTPRAGKMRAVGRIIGVKLVWQTETGANDQ